ncbi:hypothetical protein COLO4_22725 [Corchorus olitorius]|uniref:Uncharacterized protein n=1 Tax=Corchorus olitorius TaxID=93759 RepID=A0A1R3IKJ0_9ROSI|nr:hypothetical protein COLO4_22725 [Corchorus olitorius]
MAFVDKKSLVTSFTVAPVSAYFTESCRHLPSAVDGQAESP